MIGTRICIIVKRLQ